MARESSITFEQFSAAADSIVSHGGKVTSRSVREILGAGSMGTICKFLQQWRNGQIRQSQSINDTIDPSVISAISNQIANRVQESNTELMTRIADLQAEFDIIIAENERLTDENELQTAELAVQHEQRAALTGRIQQLEADANRNEADLLAERQTSEATRVELAKAELRLEAVPKIESENEKIRAELFQARTLAAEFHEVAAVATAKLEAELVQRKISEAHLYESTAREIAAAQEAATNARAEAKISGEEAAELRGQLAEAKVKTQTCNREQTQL